ncbi:HlyD family secretion protein [Gallaecimonas pentaromativorans]|uniref:efflux RND transporter periplasmic adaptor subunit n=1 Tax=Gallaecimonas pentaromativorans TaxID=584787 RepID=UPI00067F4414|nr:HlyD family secretion protein [Gallaecimonas pentaromativorans]MED5526998.1 HlyD family secretion protein [Pseudomonadota bacterium]
MKLKSVIGYAVTIAVLCGAALTGQRLWEQYMQAPWTRDGRVRANIINVASDVSGRVVEMPVKDNQQVKKGDLLLRIDPDKYQIAVEQAEALVAAKKANLKMRESEAQRRIALDRKVVSRESLDDASNGAAVAKAEYQEALAKLDEAKWSLSRTELRAPVDGYVTNLNVHQGDYAAAGVPQVAVVDQHSYWVYGYFEENKLPRIKVGDPVRIELMSGQVMQGHVDSITRAIYDRDNPQSRELVADVNPTFTWVRLAQRIPVRIHIDTIPPGLVLAAGTTATVIVKPQQPRAG